MGIIVEDASVLQFLEELKALPSVVLARAQSVIDEQLATTFAEESDPYGTSWQPRQNVGDGHPILDDTGELMASRNVTVEADGSLTISYDSPKAAYHQDGTATMPKRALLPDDRGLPESWDKAIEDAVVDILREI